MAAPDRGRELIWQSQRFDLDWLRFYNHIPIAAVVRRDAAVSVGGFRDDMRDGYEDWEFWLRLGAAGHRGDVVPEPLVNYRRHPAAAMNEVQTRHLALVHRLAHLHPDIYTDADHRRAIRERYRDRPVAAAFANLDRPGQYADDRDCLIAIAYGAATGSRTAWRSLQRRPRGNSS